MPSEIKAFISVIISARQRTKSSGGDYDDLVSAI
jgi:hypothetical protein